MEIQYQEVINHNKVYEMNTDSQDSDIQNEFVELKAHSQV